jgi:PiT family inorganic phosphate transporter
MRPGEFALRALCFGLGAMSGYRRTAKTLGERLGRRHLAPAQGACAELVGAGLIGVAGFTGYPVSTTPVVTRGIAGTMVASGAGLHRETLFQRATFDRELHPWFKCISAK